MRLLRNQLTEAEWAIAQRRAGVIRQLQVLTLAHQEALSDILGLALEVRGLSPETHEIDLQTGEIRPKGP